MKKFYEWFFDPFFEKIIRPSVVLMGVLAGLYLIVLVANSPGNGLGLKMFMVFLILIGALVMFGDAIFDLFK